MREEVSSSLEASPGFWSSSTTRQKVCIKTFSLLFVVFSISAIGFASLDDLKSSEDTYKTIEPSGNDKQCSILSGPVSSEDICTSHACVEAANTLMQNMNLSADPCNDFYQFACGNFLTETEIPDDASSIGVVSILNDKIYEQIKSVLEKKLKRESRSLKMVQTAFKTCMNTVHVEGLKTKQLFDTLEHLGHWPALRENKWNNKNVDLTNLLVKLYQFDEEYNAFFGVTVGSEPENSTNNIIWLSPFRTFMENTNNYDGTPERADELAAYRKLMFNVLKTLQMDAITYTSDDDVTKDVDEILDFETKIANIDTSISVLEDTTTLKNITKYSSSIEFVRFLKELVPDDVKSSITDETKVYAVQYDVMTAINNLIDEKGMKVTVNYLIWRLVAKYINYLDDRFDDIREEYLYEMSDQKKLSYRWRSCVKFVIDFMPLAVGALYVDEAFSPKDKKEAEKMVDMMQESFVELMKNNDWMDEKTKEKAIEKANNIIKKVGYPDFVKDDAKLDEYYKKVDISETDSFFSLRTKRAKFLREQAFEKLLVTGDRYEFSDSPAVIDASYTHMQNAMVVNAAMLQKPMFGEDVPKMINYGAAGYVIGHEITHAFDDRGRFFGNVGNMLDWWTEESGEKFYSRAECIAQNYDNIKIPGTPFSVDGVGTIGENIADGGGLRTALHGYENYVKKNGKEKRLPGLQKFTNKQMLFASFAQFHCAKETQDSLEYNILTDPHAPGYARVFGTLSNMKEFSETFNCPTDTSYNPPHKCAIW